MTLETYEKSVNVLINAYRTETLFHGNCSACAVGNLMGGIVDWVGSVGATDAMTGKHRKPSKVIPFFNNTGISIPELFEIERAFEMAIHNELLKKFSIEQLRKNLTIPLNPEERQESSEIIDFYEMWVSGSKMKEGQYLGLCAVLDVMAGMIEDRLEGDRLVEDSLVENRLVDNSLHKKELKSIATEFGVTV